MCYNYAIIETFEPIWRHFAGSNKPSDNLRNAFRQGLSAVWTGFELPSDSCRVTCREGASDVRGTFCAYAKHLTGIPKTPYGHTQKS